jgi:glutamyl-tRNA synthetase
MSERKVRVRFAPSPTGPLHIGGIRTALFNYLLAKKHGGDFILRIEDTDQTRYVPGAEEYIIESLEWCGLNFSEGPGIGGPYGPYRQSDRKEIYQKYAMELISSGNAYYAFDTADELNAKRLEAEASKEPFVYSCRTRSSMKNSLTMASADVQELLDCGSPYVIRFKIPENEKVEIFDIIRKTVVYNTAELDDKVLFKSDGMPTYHLANVIDDHLMQISHVIRGEEWLPSTPLHVLMYKAFGWEDTMPEFAHLPLILKPAGKGKLSKRDGDQLGFPVFPLLWDKGGDPARGFREDGYFPEAFINMLAFLGWNPGTEQEIFSLEQLAQAFCLDRVGKSGAKFDPEKTKWFNQQYLQAKSSHEISVEFSKFLEQKTISCSPEKIEKICGLVKDRATFVNELWDHAFYFFQAPASYDEKLVKKRWKDNVPQYVAEVRNVIASIENFTSETCETTVKEYLASKDISLGGPMNGLRLCLVGSGTGAHLFDIMEIIGKDETISRIDTAIKILPTLI